jgi:hypothetical protein
MNIFPSRLPETSGEEKVEQNREGQNEEVHDKPVEETPKFKLPRTLWWFPDGCTYYPERK